MEASWISERCRFLRCCFPSNTDARSGFLPGRRKSKPPNPAPLQPRGSAAVRPQHSPRGAFAAPLADSSLKRTTAEIHSTLCGRKELIARKESYPAAPLIEMQ